MLDMIFNVAVEGNFPSVLVDWGNDPGWADRIRGQLEAAQRISLIPKDVHAHLPIVSVDLSGDRRWVLFSRVYGQLAMGTGGRRQVRVYCLGWQQTVGETNIKGLTWVYPNGVIEMADEATMWKLYVQAQPETFKNERVAIEITG